MTTLVFATHNSKKILELKSLLPEGFSVVSAAELEVPEPEETGTTLEENSSLKANFVFNHCLKPSLADDSGLEVDALQGRPGVYSARYAGEPKSDLANLQLVLSELGNSSNRSAQFRTILSYRDQNGIYQFEGIIRGHLTLQPRGENGFGYDPIFIPEGETKTFAEMSLSEKNQYSHRAKAFQKFLTFIEGQ
ncbi:MAG: RdgB/HAM1 family non-canonical purine NTP pyrophosphatase [Bacteroidia bacterium]|nr:RdgB/HAM1 family non-canonical purine NTP pyrophosphatase [Bacteroidia bacterium]